MAYKPKLIYYNGPDTKFPKKGPYYVVASNGIFLYKENDLHKGAARVSGIGALAEFQPWLEHGYPKIPESEVAKVIKFFRWVNQSFQAEASVLIHIDEDLTEYLLHCAKQKVSMVSVNTKLSERFEGFRLAGRFHSHGTMTAFHSGIDDAAETEAYGLYITIGNVNLSYFTISCSIFVNRTRFQINPEDIIEGIYAVDWMPPLPHKRFWRKRLEVEDLQTEEYFHLDALDNPDVEFPEIWKKKVNKLKNVYPVRFDSFGTGV